MKTFKYTVFILLAIFFSSCTTESWIYDLEAEPSRIKINESRVIDGYRYSIIEVDSVEYLTQSNGGFIKIPNQ